MEIYEVASNIEKRVVMLDEYREFAAKAAQISVEATAAYEKKIAIVLMGLNGGKEFELDEETIQNPPVSIMEKLAKGICFEERTAMDLADKRYKLAMKNLENLTTQITALQSILRQFSHREV